MDQPLETEAPLELHEVRSCSNPRCVLQYAHSGPCDTEGKDVEVRLVPPDLCDTIADYAGQVPQIQALLTYAAKGLVGQYKAQFKIHFEKLAPASRGDVG